MRKFLVGSLVLASMGSGAVVMGQAAFASGPTQQCNTSVAKTPAGDVSVLAPSGASTAGELQACSNSSPIVDGTATAEGSGGASGVNGYVIANGEPGSPATGYIGVEGSAGPTGGSANVVGCSSGDYSNGSATNPSNSDGSATQPNDGPGTTDSNGNNVIVGTNGNSLSQTATGNCAITNEPHPALP
ncbi:MAG: hypothetical protein ACYDD4_14565 [Acidimicrobiales bacterium]